MKRAVSVALAVAVAIACLLTCCLVVDAHSGRTDQYGGHYDRSTGDYHYHHGYPAHQHESGVCPYEDNVVTSKSITTSATKSYSDPPSIQGYWVAAILGLALGLPLLYQTAKVIVEKNKRNDNPNFKSAIAGLAILGGVTFVLLFCMSDYMVAYFIALIASLIIDVLVYYRRV